ncbi:SUMF1/EgtB/PvdO family nonheme iron enzyme [Bradyrhizobium sp. AUGA SZCCT0283]|uniref:SUMF1/EgtB/PvdO family nonheme iron enzyme n=1 Tax=Bradyrhizobium sp. AUGA SZCCT0283 TaxID=2807671 RepID=UPI001BACD70E|nr:SUMF1/EgtB/PvdO family nonheme iron enzyme [Bradyrhizobium sp. AUGA SZCCT0283]MBR1275261.1 SUMF1/EgtB/PvdO family nonheme iron enzyme [Bradyrhizobium sp. AUGA SZCCT0283]
MAQIRDIKSGRFGAPTREPMPRRLAAIVAGDISGYSRLMQIDEEGTHSRVKRIERDLIEPSIVEHHGRLVKTTGDGFIAIFDSPVEAVRCSIVIQQNLVGRNAALPKHHWIEYRIGVNLGDVIIETDDVYGDGVNIATRLEGIAQPGEVYISGGIYEQIKHKLVCGYESLGDRHVKNITDPVRVYRVLSDPAALMQNRKRREGILVSLLILALLLIAGGALWSLLPNGKLPNLVSAPVSPPAEVQKAPAASPPAPPAQPAPTVAPTQQQAAPQPEPSAAPKPAPSPAPQQAAPLPPSASPAAPAGQPTTQAAASIREPEMVSLRGGSFAMGSNEDVSEKPVHQVTVKPFAMGKFPVSVREWNDCAAAKACGFTASGKDDAPVANVSWSDARQYVAWLAETTRKPYRLPSEAEWEYAARGGTQTRYWWGDQFQPGMVNCKNCSDIPASDQPVKVGSLKPNPFGLFDMGGGVDQWVEDCWHKNYQGAPVDGSAWVENECPSHVIRSGSWRKDSAYARTANRGSYDTNVRYPTHGFRIALSP